LLSYVDLNRHLRRGETTRICMEALANEGPLDTRQLALRIIKAKGLSESDKVLAQSIALRVVQTLRMRARRNKVECVTKTKGVCVWRLPTGAWQPKDQCEHYAYFLWASGRFEMHPATDSAIQLFEHQRGNIIIIIEIDLIQRGIVKPAKPNAALRDLHRKKTTIDQMISSWQL
jgi:hypothetical protein